MTPQGREHVDIHAGTPLGWVHAEQRARGWVRAQPSPDFLFLGHTHQARTPKANRMHAFTWQHARVTRKNHGLLR